MWNKNQGQRYYKIVLFFVVIPRASCIFSNSRYLARYVKDPGKEGWVNLEKTLE